MSWFPILREAREAGGDFHKPEWAAGDWLGGRVRRNKQRGPTGWPWVFALDALSKGKESDCYPPAGVKENTV